MGLLGGSEVENVVDASVEEVKERSDEVYINDMRSPSELIDQVDRLESAVVDLENRQRQFAQIHSGELEDTELSESAGVYQLEKVEDGSVDLESLEKRLKNLEVAVDRLESGIEMSAEELRDNILGEAVEFENSKLQEIDKRISKLEDQKVDVEDDLRERVAVLEKGVEILVQKGPEMEERTEEVENNLEELAEKDEEVTQDIDRRLKELEQSKESSDVTRDEFEDLKQQVEEMSKLLVRVADQNQD